MSSVFDTLSSLIEAKPWQVILLGLSAIFTVMLWLTNGFGANQADGKEPPAIPEWLPGVGNAYRYVFQNMEFLRYVRVKFRGSDVMKFQMGPQIFYLITGAKNSQFVVKGSGHLSSDDLTIMAIKQLDGADPEDIQKFKDDKSGRSPVPLVPGPEENRLWATIHRLFHDYLASSTAVEILSGKFVELFTDKLDTFSKQEWHTLQLYQFLRKDMAECAVISLCGSEILRLNPDLIEHMWKYDAVVYPLVMSVPKFLFKKAYVARDEFHSMGAKYLLTLENFDWQTLDSDPDWEPIFGSRFMRKHSRFLKDRGFSLRSRSGMHLGSVWALNANAIPVVTWALIEIIRDKTLFEAIRTEVASAFTVDTSGKKILDLSKLRELPLLQSIYSESLRMHVSVNLTRGVTQDIQLDGYTLKKGALIQTPSMVAHYDEKIWSEPEHPASEFWAERHIIYTDKVRADGSVERVPKFSVGRRSGGFFPFGGGIGMCPGRHFAKVEIMSAIALLVSNFDMEFLEYVNMDGSKSDRPPRDDPWYCGTASMPPDRDMKIRWKKV